MLKLSLWTVLFIALLALPARATEDAATSAPATTAIPQICYDAYDSDDAARAVELWTECLSQPLPEKTRGIALFNRGRRRMDLAEPDPEKAIEDYTEAATIMRLDADVYVNRGYAHLQLKSYTDAHSDFSRAIALNPQDAIAYADRGAVNQHLGQLAEAVYDLEKAIALDPAHRDALFSLATLLAMEEDAEIRDGQRAVEVALRLVNLERNWETLEILAAAHAEAEQFSQAIDAQKEALEHARASHVSTRVLEDNLKRYERNRKYR